MRCARGAPATSWRAFPLSLLLLAFAHPGLAQGALLPAEVVLTRLDPQRVAVEVRADPIAAGRSELFWELLRRGAERVPRALVRPTEAGVYRFEIPLAGSEPHGLSLRYGVGLAVSYAYLEIPRRIADPAAEAGTVFRGSVGFRPIGGERIAGWVQPLGFAAFGVVLLVTVVLSAAVLRRFARARRRGGDLGGGA